MYSKFRLLLASILINSVVIRLFLHRIFADTTRMFSTLRTVIIMNICQHYVQCWVWFINFIFVIFILAELRLKKSLRLEHIT